MNFNIDLEKQEILTSGGSTIPLYSKEGFSIISDLWLKVGWDQKYPYSFSWLGRPIIQIPEDAFRIQEAIFNVKPDVIIETGIAHGGSLVLSASICKAVGKGRVIGIDIEIRPHNRKAIEDHPLFDFIELVEGNSISKEIFSKIRSCIGEDDKVLVILDSCHSYEHVKKELELYSQLVTPGSFIVATDGSQQYLNETPRAKKDYPDCHDWPRNNPLNAAEDFVAENKGFKIVEPQFLFNEGEIDFRVTLWPRAYILKL